MKGILADNNSIGQIEAVVHQMRAGEWAEFWTLLGLELKRFEEVGLSPESSDLEIWRTCQAEQLILVTDNRNLDAPDSLEAVIRQYNQPHSLLVFTISDLNTFGKRRAYAERVLKSFFDYLFRIDEVRGTGRLYLP